MRIASRALLSTDASLPAARAAGDAFFGRDRHQRWNLYTGLAPTTDISEVLDEIDRDPTHIFWANPGRSAITAAFSTAAASHARRAFFRVRRHWDREEKAVVWGDRPVRRSCWSMGAVCTHRRYDVRMPKVIQIRDVPDEVRDALAQAADAEGLSLTGYVRRELEHLARRSQRVRDNAAVVRRTQSEVGARIDRDLILSELHEGRRD